MSNAEKSTRPSSADYPVDPAERSSQEARLRKAAAAGASSSKSPIPGLMLQRPPSSSASQKAAEPQATSSNSTDLIESAPEISIGRSALPIMNDEVIVELQKISASADLQRKFSKWTLVFVAVYVPVVIGIFLLIDRQLKTNVESNLPPQQSDWSAVDRNVRQGDFEKGIAIGEELILKTPQFAEAHERLARAYLAAGNLEKAKEHYAEAFRLFPSEENERLLSAIEKRVNADRP
jgi:tetratricopeptide (TPR) repeat protein